MTGSAGLVLAIVVNADRGGFIESLVIPFLRALALIEGWPHRGLFDLVRRLDGRGPSS